MTRAEFEAMEFEELMEELNRERDDITSYEMLKEYATEKIEEDSFSCSNSHSGSITE